MRHINREGIDVLRGMPGRGVDYNGDIQACDACAVSKSEQQAHQKQASYDVQHAFQLVTVDLMRPLKPATLGGYSYVTKVVDQNIKWKEIFLIKTTPQVLDALELHNKELVIPINTSLIRPRADKSTEFTSSEFRQYGHDIGVRQRLPFPTHLSKSDLMNGQEVLLLELCVACLLIRVYWGEVMQTTV